MNIIHHTLLALCLLASSSASAVRYHVNVSATGNGTGLTWANAFTDIQEALSIVIPGDEIWVAAGQYKATSGTNRSVSFVLRNGVDLYGSFAGTETAVDQRDIDMNPTTLNGDIGELGNNTDNTYNIISGNNITTNIVVDGFRIQNGRASGSNGGGGLRITNALSGELLLRNCAFLSNYSSNYGGGIYLAAARLRIESCSFISNDAGSGGNGGAICNGNNNGGSSTLTIVDCVFKNNVARVGACLYNSVTYRSLLIDRCVFTNNTSPNSILDIDHFITASLLNSYIIGNTVNDFSGNVLNVNSFSSTDEFLMANCTVAHNYNLYSNTIQDQIIRLDDTQHRIYNCIISGNTAYAGRQVNTTPFIGNSLIAGGHTNGTAIIDADPQFVAPYTGTPGNFDASSFDYTLLPSSPAINTGDNDQVLPDSELDLNGDERIQGGVVDMGCYESTLSVGLNEVVQRSTSWHFDQQNNLLQLAEFGQENTVMIFNSQGQVVQRITFQGNSAPVSLPAGLYVAHSGTRAPLKFVVGQHL